MAATTYTYSIAGDTADAAVQARQLHKEVLATDIDPEVERIDISGDVLDVIMDAALTAGEKTTLDGVVAAHAGYLIDFKRNYLKEEYTGGKLVAATWYAVKDGGGNFLHPVEQNTYTYSGSTVIQQDDTHYDEDGNTIESTTWSFTTDSQGNSSTITKEKN